MRKTARSNSGMTMLELMVVIAVFGIFMAIAIPTVLKSLTAMGRVKNSTATYPQARRALGTVCDTFRQAYAAAGAAGMTGRNSAYEAGGMMIPADEVIFPILDSRYARLGSVQNMTFKLQLSPTSENTLRGLIKSRAPLGAPAEAGLQEALLEEAIGLDVKYLDDSQDPPAWVQQWPPEEQVLPGPLAEAAVALGLSDQTAPLPAAVEITLYVLGKVSSQPTPFQTVVYLPAAQKD